MVQLARLFKPIFPSLICVWKLIPKAAWIHLDATSIPLPRQTMEAVILKVAMGAPTLPRAITLQAPPSKMGHVNS